MAPIRSRPQASQPAGIGKKVHRKARPQREPSDSWELLEQHGLNGEDYEASHPHQQQDVVLQDPVDVDEAMNPLREMAEKVEKEVETFAETLDKFFTELPTVSNRFDAAHDLVLQFKVIASQTVEDLKRSNEQEMRQQLRKEWSEQANVPNTSTMSKSLTSSKSTSMTTRKAEQVKKLRQWQQEVDIWELFRIMLDLHPFESDAQAILAEKEEKLNKLGQPHRYTSEADLWERFLLEDDLARERHMIKTWLEQTADHQESDVQSIVEELESKAGRGKGLWSSGWMHTREKIKGEKRLRNWPNPGDTPLPQIMCSNSPELLTTTLDPDAPSREKRSLEKPDSYFERAIWVACWEMLRRGRTLHEISEWCEERKEGWRALVMGGALDDSESTTSKVTWRYMCLLASQSPASYDYEAAVFGALGGNVRAMERVSHTVDDHLYAHYTAALTRQFEQYLLQIFPERMSSSGVRSSTYDSSSDAEQAQEAISNLISRLRKKSATSKEAAKPMKIIQSFLLADEVGSLIHTVGASVSETAALQGPEDMIFLRDRPPLQGDQPRGEVEVAMDMQTLRIVTHMSIIHRVLSPSYLEGDELLEDENVLVAYIQALRAGGKRLLIPTYAAKLQRSRYIVLLGRILQDITDEHEQTHMIRLLEEAEMDVVAILQEQLAWIMDTTFEREYAEKPLTILEPADNTKLHPAYKIKSDFLPDEVTASDDAIIKALRWFQLLPGNWEISFRAMTLALRRCLVIGRFACARMIIQNFPSESTSLQKSYETIGRSLNIHDENSTMPQNEEESLAIDLLKRQSRTYHELELLVRAIEALSAYGSEEDKYTAKQPKPTSIPTLLKRAKEAVSDGMEPLLRGILMNPVDESEAQDLQHIRLTYIPEVILAYNAVLHAAGNLITREALLESMDLSTIIANGSVGLAQGVNVSVGDRGEVKYNGLAEDFVKAGRMRELVSSFAYTSKAMLVLKAEGRPWKPKRERLGRELGIWEIGGAAA